VTASSRTPHIVWFYLSFYSVAHYAQKNLLPQRTDCAFSYFWLLSPIWMYKSSFTSWKTPIVLFALLNALTVTIAAYFTPMTLGVMLCYALQETDREEETDTSPSSDYSNLFWLFWGQPGFSDIFQVI
jgi:hypothetical protein